MAADGAFGDLRKLADWFSTPASLRSGGTTLQLQRITRRLGATAIRLLGRELRHGDPRRREAAREALAWLATTSARGRVIDELRSAATDARDDDAKLCALGLLAELGAPATATFADPLGMQRRSALALAAQLETPADVASAADLMVRQLDETELHQMLEVLVEVAPAAAQRLAGELAARLDLAADRRERIAAITGSLAPRAANASNTDRRAHRATHAVVLVDAAARLVVIASRKVSGERRWRRWAVLIGHGGVIEDCLHEDDAPNEADGGDGSLTAALCDDGYRIASTDLDHARTVVTAAARGTDTLPSAYYLGRDLLELGDAHLADVRLGARRDPQVVALARAVELLAAGEHARAQAMLEGCEPATHAESSLRALWSGALGAAHLAQGRAAAAIDPLTRAIACEPAWPLHHWNLATALHQLGDASGCYQALRRFVATSAHPTGLAADPDQPARLASAERMLAELQRTARLTGTSLRRRRKRTT